MLQAAAASGGINSLSDSIISVEDVKSFKPSPRVYHLASSRVEGRRGRGYTNLRYLLLTAQRQAATKTEFISLKKAA